MLPKPRTPIKIHFLIQTKTSSSNFIFSWTWGADIFTLVKTLIFREVILIFAKQKGLNRDINFAAKTKKTSKKAILDKTKTSDQRLLESSESDVFRFFDFWLWKGVFGFGGIWLILWWIDYFNFAIFLGHI